MPISEEDKQLVRKRANYLCEYCHSSERLSPSRFTMEHLIPQSLGGSDHTDNLALACRRCNERRYNFVEALDPQTQQMVPLFNPRKQVWREHFVWANDNTVIEEVTAIGRATCQRRDVYGFRLAYILRKKICKSFSRKTRREIYMDSSFYL